MKRAKPKEPVAWWSFSGDNETFTARDPDRISRLYFPLCNDAGLLSAITPDLHGDIKTGQNSFLTLPLATEDLHNTRSARNFWVYIEGRGPWSATASKAKESCQVEAGALWHKVTRENRTLGLRSSITNFVPAGRERVEIMRVEITNIGRKPLSITPTAAIPLFARSADNLRDHRHVSSLLHRVVQHDHGVIVTPTMSFDERGHQPNQVSYAVLGCNGQGEAPVGSFPTVASFIGEGGNFDSPQAVFDDLDVPDLSDAQLQGREAMGALRFKTRKLAPGKSAVYLVLMGVAADRKEISGWLRSYGTDEKVLEALADSKSQWKERLDQIQITTGDDAYGRWLRWVNLQPILRKIFGNSFLPDFDYGRGGRGWRDLWQDCLGLLLLDTGDVRNMLLNNFGGVRMNGTNATIIGKAPGEFIADRNNISRVWMDHGVWPWLTTEFYLHQTGDSQFLLEQAPYFWDRDKGNVSGSVLEHLLVQHLTAYFNVGAHGNCCLLDADWNDGLDMAPDRGESVPFTAVFAGNLISMANTLEHLKGEKGFQEIELAEELEVLLESNGPSASDAIDMANSLSRRKVGEGGGEGKIDVPSSHPSPDASVGRRSAITGRRDASSEGILSSSGRQERLKAYRTKTAAGISGRKRTISLDALIKDLRAKGEALAQHVREQEWIKTDAGHAWFNGYYDNNGERVEGPASGGVRMTLTGQVFPIMSGIATNEQVQQCFVAAKKYLQDKKLGGFRLNTDFGTPPPPLGRALSFAYGEKENGAFFSHMVVMFANALYRRGFVEEGHEVFSSLYRMCMNADVARIYPGIPEYFNGEGRGLYHYLTGSASWYLLTLVTQVLGVRGQWGDLLLAPKLMPDQFGVSGQVCGEISFAGKRLKITYVNRSKKPFGQYHIESVLLQGKSFAVPTNSAEVVIPRQTVTDLAAPVVEITVALA